MKLFSFVLCTALGVWAAPMQARLVHTEALEAERTVVLNDASLEGGLFQFSKVGGLNVLIDSTNIKATKERTTQTFGGKFGSAIFNYTRPFDLTAAMAGQNTFLFWQAADIEEIVSRIVSGENRWGEANAISNDALFTMMRDHVRKDPQARAQLTKPFSLSDLPEPLRAPVASAAFASISSQNRLGLLGEEVWKNARVQLESIRPDTLEEAKYTGMKFPALRWLRVKALFTTLAGATQITATLPRGVENSIFPPAAKEVPEGTPLYTGNGNSLRALSSPRPLLEAGVGPGLDATITLEAERKPLRQVLDEVEKQSGLRLSTQQAPVLDALLLSARTDKMPLLDLMNGLDRLYSIGWKKIGEREWTADATPRTTDNVLATRVGDTDVYKFFLRGGEQYKEWVAASDDTIARALEEVDEAELRSPEGVPFSALSPQVQKEIQQGIRSRIKLSLATSQSMALAVIRNGVTLRFGADGEILSLKLPGDISSVIALNRSIFEDAIKLEKEAALKPEKEALQKRFDELTQKEAQQ